jgi:sialate O-acetylesterase
MNTIQSRLLAILFLFVAQVSLAQDLKLPAIFSDYMVLQQKTNAPVWGWAAPEKTIQVIGSWNNKTVTAVSDKSGKWMVKLTTPVAGGPYTLMVKGDNTITFQNVLIGEVWVCSGQSNMEMPMTGWPNTPVFKSDTTIKQASNYPNIRLFNLQKKISETPLSDCTGKWVVSSSESVAAFSATGYFFGLELYKRLNIPVGLIMTAWGGTPSEAWTSDDYISKYDEFKPEIKKLSDFVITRDSMAIKDPANQPKLNSFNANYPTSLFNGMINPLIPFAIKGAIWYQGESNVYDAKLYAQIFPEMVKCWRTKWNQGDFPFYYVQIAPYDYGATSKSELLREAQLLSLKNISNSGMAVTMDIATIKNIHPPDKESVGKRLAYWALAKSYNIKNLAYSGPLYKKMMIENNEIKLYFDYAKNGLEAKGSELTNFEIAGKDRKFFPALAIIENNTVTVHSFDVPTPVAVRYGWSNTATPNLFNIEGLPASSFRTDEWDK